MNIFLVYGLNGKLARLDRAFVHQSVAMGYVEDILDPEGRAALDWGSRQDGTLVHGDYEIRVQRVETALTFSEFRESDDARQRAALIAGLTDKQRRLLGL